MVNENKWKILAANWDKYREHSEELFGSYQPKQNVNKTNNYFISIINEVSEEFIPRQKLYKGRGRRNAQPWWDDDCDKSKIDSKRAYYEYKNNLTF